MTESNYDEFTRRMLSGEPMTEELWLSHFTHQNANATSGLDEGEPAPPFSLSDQHGAARSLDDLVGEGGLLLAFARSADW
jgi:hypothetical protein